MKGLVTSLLTLLLWLGWALPMGAEGLQPADLDDITQQWQGSAHALNQVNCSSCHQNEAQAFVAQPDQESCRSCHEQAVDTFLLGKHGIRLLEGESPLTPAMARLPMQPAAHDLQMTCGTCHNVHTVNTQPAAVDACLTCHSDSHSLNYKASKHAGLFAAEASLPRPSASAVSCATCHLPRHSLPQGDGSVTLVNHNNTYTLLPRDRMVQEVCMNCHGVEYSYNSIFDDALVEANFDAPPSLAMETFELMRALEDRRSSPTESQE